MGSQAATAPHPVFARVWSRISGKVGSDRQRSEMLQGLDGRVLEVGAGDGRNFGHYPDTVADVLAVEPEPYLRELAERAAARSSTMVTVLEGTAEVLPADDGEFDAAVTSLVLCSVSDQVLALAELRRVIREGGELRFFEHVVAEQSLGRALQRGLDDSGIWPRLGGGCHLKRDTVSAISQAGFEIEKLRRFSSGPGSMGVPFVLGVARRA